MPVIVSMETGGMMSGGIGPRSGAQATRGSPRPTPRAPFDADTVNHVVASQLSTTERLPKIRSMSRAQGVSLLSSHRGNPQSSWNSTSTSPDGLYSVSIPYTDQPAVSAMYAP